MKSICSIGTDLAKISFREITWKVNDVFHSYSFKILSAKSLKEHQLCGIHVIGRTEDRSSRQDFGVLGGLMSQSRMDFSEAAPFILEMFSQFQLTL